MIKFFLTGIIVNLLIAGVGYGQEPVKVYEQPLAIPTYLVAPAEKAPIFYTGRTYQGAQGHIYPYPMSDKLTDERKDVTYKALYLENEFTKVCVLPEIGGRIFQAVDKTNNFDFFYKQNVIKPSLIGMLGAWISGGVEWNIPHHHRASTYMPVDYSLVENKDGSKSIWVGETELRNRLKWSVCLSLIPGRSYIEATVRIVNSTPFAQSFLYWVNVSVHSKKDYQVIFPPSTQFGVGHAKNEFIDWPVAKGKYGHNDLSNVGISWWKNHPVPTSIFAWNFKDDFLAGYDHALQAGTVHVADHNVVGGKKFFLWGNNEQSQMWDKILTETDGPYTELMVGAYSDNQPDYSWIGPGEVRTFKQYWYPISKIGGVKYANIDGVVNLDIQDTKAKVGFETTKSFENAKVLLKIDNKPVFEKTITISPSAPFVADITLPYNTSQYDVEAILTDNFGQVLLSYKPIEYKKEERPKPVEPPRNPKEYSNVEELYYTGLRLEQFYNGTTDPMPYFKEALSRDSLDYRTNTTLGVYYMKNGQFAESEMHLRRAVKRITKNYTRPKDGEAFYYLGTLLKYDNRIEEADDMLHKATWYPGFQTPAYTALAEIECIRGNYSKALELIDESINTLANNQNHIGLKAGILRKLGRTSEAIAMLKQSITEDALEFRTKYELYLNQSEAGTATETVTALSDLTRAMRGNAQSYLELATKYSDCGMWTEGTKLIKLLTESGSPESNNPELYYYLGYFAKQIKMDNEAVAFYAKGSSLPIDYCFPFRIESLKILLTGRNLNNNDPKIAYYLGEIYCFFRQFDIAIDGWEKAIINDNKLAMAYRNLGFVYSKYKNDNFKAISYYEKAFELDKTNSHLLFELDELYKASNVDPAKRLANLETNLSTVEKRDETLINLLQLYIFNEKYDAALSYLNNRHFHVWEGGGEIHSIFRDVCLLRGIKWMNEKKYDLALADFQKANLFPDNLEVGRPINDQRAAQVNYYTGLAYEAMGNQKLAAEMFTKAANSEIETRSDYAFYRAQSLEKIGKNAEATEIYKNVIQYCTENINKDEGLDFFEKFGTDMSKDTKKARFHYLLALANLGVDNKINAKAELQMALKLNVNHVWANRHFKNYLIY